eukprot:TRINITY_DN128_c0_g1_i5.p1 TRINITY_DN128_c0_g1~~TRINITY_DN128_c0_g1_i5.p1  ORF type:complete len:245 (-),score=28.45 TRINITY_DN128_c0_g1_i5:300-1034(-)
MNPGATGCDIKKNTDYPGNDIHFIHNVMTAEACAIHCENFNGCASWTWGKEPGQVITNKCHLKSLGSPNGVSSDCCDSGLKNACANNGAVDHQASLMTAVELSSNGDTVVTNIGSDEFNRIFALCPVVIYERNSDTHSVYKRTSSISSSFDAFAMFTDTWRDENNVPNVDFEVYNSVEDIQTQTNRWSFCNYNDPDVGYPRDCGMSGSVFNRWFSMPGGRLNARGLSSGAAFKLYESDCPLAST